jgi:hypothetical protein
MLAHAPPQLSGVEASRESRPPLVTECVVRAGPACEMSCLRVVRLLVGFGDVVLPLWRSFRNPF